MLFSELNLINISSRLFKGQVIDITKLHEEIAFDDEAIMIDFNNRLVTPLNVNRMISYCEFLMIDYLMGFIVTNAAITNTSYVLNEQNAIKYKLPDFMTCLTPINVLNCHIPNMHRLIEWFIYSCPKKNKHFARFVYYAIKNGHIDCFEYLCMNNHSWDICSLELLIHYDKFTSYSCLINNKCPYNGDLLYDVIKLNGFKEFHYAKLNGVKHDDHTLFHKMVVYDRDDWLKHYNRIKCFIMSDYLIIVAITNDSIGCLKFFHNIGVKIFKHEYVCRAAKSDPIKCLTYLHDQGCVINPEVYSYAISAFGVHCIKYIQSHDFSWINDTLYSYNIYDELI